MAKRKDRKMGRSAGASAIALSDLGPAYAVRDKAGKVIGQRLYREHHGGVVLEPVARDLRGNVTAVRAHAKVECVLDAYWRRCKITDRQHESGMVFRSYWMMAAAMPRVSADYGERKPKGQGDDYLPGVIADAKRKRDELQAKLTADQLLVVIGVCGMDEWAGGSARLDDLRTGLNALANHLRIPKPKSTPS